MKYIFIQILKGYKYFISPFLGNNCRFYPSCSEYMMVAIDRFGVLKGVKLGAKRLGRCHPGNEGGIDHVPQSKNNTETCEHNHEKNCN